MSRKRKARRVARLNFEAEKPLPVAREVSKALEESQHSETEIISVLSRRVEKLGPSITDQHQVLREIRLGMSVATEPKDGFLSDAIIRACDEGFNSGAIGQAMKEGIQSWRENPIGISKERGG